MITVTTPPVLETEKMYSLSVLLTEFMGLTFSLRHDQQAETTLNLTHDPDGKKLILSDHFFQTASNNWLRDTSLPSGPLDRWDAHNDLPEANLVRSELPVIYGEPHLPGTWFKQDAEGIRLGLDIIGSAFFMLTRYEEVVKQERDERDRFPASASLAYQEGFLERPIINEYLEILWSCMKRIWPSLSRFKRQSRILVSHDVDWPLTRDSRLFGTLKSAVADIVKRKAPAVALQRIRNHVERKHSLHHRDPHNTFRMLMETSEGLNLKSAFYFITDQTAGAIDGEYTMEDPWIRRLLSEIHTRGHEIGLHPSYATYNNGEQIIREFNRLLATTELLGITQSRWGGRQHYLRWQAPTTWQLWCDAGLDYDSTLSYADHAGFRTGVCYEYPVFNLLSGRRLPLQERPLVVMEGTLLGRRYMNLDYPAALEQALALRQRCFMFDGDFTLLWHNSHFLRVADFEVYRRLLEVG